MSKNRIILISTLVIVLFGGGIYFTFGVLDILNSSNSGGPVRNYDDIKIPDGLNCESVRNGTFEKSDYKIYRMGNIQQEWSKGNAEPTEYKVTWNQDCEYFLTPKNSDKVGTMVKITNVEAAGSGYSCYYVHTESSFNFATFLSLERTR